MVLLYIIGVTVRPAQFYGLGKDALAGTLELLDNCWAGNHGHFTPAFFPSKERLGIRKKLFKTIPYLKTFPIVSKYFMNGVN